MRIGELSRRVGVNTDTLRAWERRYGVLRPRRTAGNTRLYSALDEARIRLMQRYIDEQLPVAQAAELAMSRRLKLTPGAVEAVEGHEIERARTELATALEAFDETSADRALQQLFAAFAPTAVLRDVIIPYLHDIGERWADNHMTIAQEHFASNFIHARLQSLSRGWDRGLGPRAVLAAAPGDQHTLGLICFGIALHRLGWRIVFLGADTPVAMLGQTAEATAASAVVVSASVVGMLEPSAASLRALADQMPLAVGGPGTTSELAERCAAMHLGEPFSAAASLAVTHADGGEP